MRVGAQRESRVLVTEPGRNLADVLPRVEQHRRARVPEGVEADLTRTPAASLAAVEHAGGGSRSCSRPPSRVANIGPEAPSSRSRRPQQPRHLGESGSVRRPASVLRSPSAAAVLLAPHVKLRVAPSSTSSQPSPSSSEIRSPVCASSSNSSRQRSGTAASTASSCRGSSPSRPLALSHQRCARALIRTPSVGLCGRSPSSTAVANIALAAAPHTCGRCRQRAKA